MFGLDPDVARAELEKGQKVAEIERLSEDELRDKNRETWSAWLGQYQAALSEMDHKVTDEKRAAHMNKVNPKFILRNYLLENAIRAADDQGDYSKVEELLTMSMDPYNEAKVSEISTQPAPKWALKLCVSCSS